MPKPIESLVDRLDPRGSRLESGSTNRRKLNQRQELIVVANRGQDESLQVGRDWDGKGLPDLVVSNYLPEGGAQHGTHVIAIVSMEDARLLHYVTPQDMATLIRERDEGKGPR